jgi:hypothetical protein
MQEWQGLSAFLPSLTFHCTFFDRLRRLKSAKLINSQNGDGKLHKIADIPDDIKT